MLRRFASFALLGLLAFASMPAAYAFDTSSNVGADPACATVLADTAAPVLAQDAPDASQRTAQANAHTPFPAYTVDVTRRLEGGAGSCPASLALKPEDGCGCEGCCGCRSCDPPVAAYSPGTGSAFGNRASAAPYLRT